MKYDAIIIGAGISGLTCASLLAKRNLKVCVVDAQYKPGGACGIFKREDTGYGFRVVVANMPKSTGGGCGGGCSGCGH